jgi:Tfp pilus assembly protein PilO
MTAKKKTYLTIFLFFAASLALVFFAIVPLFGGIKSYSSDLSSAKSERAQLSAEIKNLSDFKKQFQQYQTSLDRADSLLVNSEIPIDFIRFLEKLASDSGVLIEIYPLSGRGKGGGQWLVLNYQLSVSGSFLDFSRFLEKLENSSYLIEAQDMNLQKSVENKIEKVKASFTIKVLAK